MSSRLCFLARANARTSICSTFLYDDKNRILVLAQHLISPSILLSVFIPPSIISLNNVPLGCEWIRAERKQRKRGSALLRSSRLHVCDVIITHIKGCALNTTTVSFPGGVIKNEQSKLARHGRKRTKTSPRTCTHTCMCAPVNCRCTAARQRCVARQLAQEHLIHEIAR